MLAAAGVVYFSIDAKAAAKVIADYGVNPRWPLAIVALVATIAIAIFRLRDAWPAWFCALTAALVTTGIVVYPQTT